MGGIVPIFDDPNWRDRPGAELASVGSEDMLDLEHKNPDGPAFGLTFHADSQKWVAPRAQALMIGTLRVQDLDDEELLRGQVRDADGQFRHGAARRVPKEFHDELMRRILERGVDKLRGSFLKAIEVLTDDIIDDDTVDIRLRYDAAKYIIERLGGKTPDVVQATVQVKRWEKVMDRIVTELPVLDAEVVDDDDESDKVGF